MQFSSQPGNVLAQPGGFEPGALGTAIVTVTPGRHTVSDRALFVHTVSDRALVAHTVSDEVPVG